jgi:hypothetical protein
MQLDRRTLLMGAAASSLGLPAVAWAQEFPTKQILLIAPWPAWVERTEASTGFTRKPPTAVSP